MAGAVDFPAGAGKSPEETKLSSGAVQRRRWYDACFKHNLGF